MTTPPKTILITGASSGIGAALAKAYAAKGHRLLITGRNAARLHSIEQECHRAGSPHVVQAVLDVLDRPAMLRWITERDDEFTIDCLIANAGISGGTGGQALEADDQVRRILDTSITGSLNTIQPLVPRMMDRGGGRIALMASLASFSAWPGAPSYAAAKAAVRIYGEGLRIALAPHNVRVSVICPGFVDTPLTQINPYRMPLLMDADRAARLIMKGIDQGAGRIAFPFATYGVAGLIGLLPFFLQEKLLSLMPSKPAGTSQ